MAQFRDVLITLNRLKAEGVIRDCAVGQAAVEDRDPVTPGPRETFAAKARWHDEQRRLSPREKIRILIELQHREAESNRIRASLGRPVIAMKPWDTRA